MNLYLATLGAESVAVLAADEAAADVLIDAVLTRECDHIPERTLILEDCTPTDAEQTYVAVGGGAELPP